MLIAGRENTCDKRRGWKTHVPVHTCLPLTAKRQIKGTGEGGGGGGKGGGGAAAFTSLKCYQSVSNKEFSGETRDGGQTFAKTAVATACGGFGDI